MGRGVEGVETEKDKEREEEERPVMRKWGGEREGEGEGT